MRNAEIKVIEVEVVSSNLEKRGRNYNWELCQKITSRSNSTKKLFAMVNIKTNDGNSGAVKFNIRVFSKFNEESGNAYKYVQLTDTTTKFGTVTVSTSDFIHGKFTQELTINYQYYLNNKRQVVNRVKVKYENKINDVEQELNNEKYEHRQEIKAHDVTKKENKGLKYELEKTQNALVVANETIYTLQNEMSNNKNHYRYVKDHRFIKDEAEHNLNESMDKFARLAEMMANAKVDHDTFKKVLLKNFEDMFLR